MRRRRFLSLAAAFACAPHLARANTWRGYALGAEVSVTLHGPRDLAEPALAEVPELLRRVEDAFSLFQPTSLLSRLNSAGRLADPDALMLDLMRQVDHAFDLTGGLFDPTIQSLWTALAQGADTEGARASVGWDRVQHARDRVVLGAGQTLTFNGIAQGYATDLIREVLVRHGAERALVNIGEQAAIGGPFTVGLSDPMQGHLGTRRLADMAVATSSPDALRLGEATHILGPRGEVPVWSTVSIEATSATLADALSTAAVFMDRDALVTLKEQAGLHRITFVDREGRLRTV